MYDTNAQAISDKLKATSSTVFTQDTIESILSLLSSPTSPTVVADNLNAENNATVNPAADVQVAFIKTSDTSVTTLGVSGSTPVVFFEGRGGVDASVGVVAPATALGNESASVVAGVDIERVVVGSAGADTITIVDGKNTQVVAGDKDTVVAGSGQTVVVAAQGNVKVIGNDKTIVKATGVEEDFVVTVTDGQAKVANAKTGVSVDLSGVDYVQLDGDDALIFAENSSEALVANLYHALLGRNADAAGLEFWYDRVEENVSLEAITNAFLTAAEYTGSAQTDAQFIDGLYTNLLGRSADATGKDFWVDALESGMSRAVVTNSFAQAALDGTEVNVVGTVTIVDPTV